MGLQKVVESLMAPHSPYESHKPHLAIKLKYLSGATARSDLFVEPSFVAGMGDHNPSVAALEYCVGDSDSVPAASRAHESASNQRVLQT